MPGHQKNRQKIKEGPDTNTVPVQEHKKSREYQFPGIYYLKFRTKIGLLLNMPKNEVKIIEKFYTKEAES